MGIFFIKDLNTRDNLCEKTFHPASVKNENADVAMRKTLCNMKGVNNAINLEK